MKQKWIIIHFLLTLSATVVLAQGNGWRGTVHLDTVYYPFYNGVQMIEIDHIQYWHLDSYLIPDRSAIPYLPTRPVGNVFLFRDTTGTIVKAFNQGESLDELTRHFKKIPLDKPCSGNHSGKEPIPYQSPLASLSFPGYYKVSTGIARQGTADNSQSFTEDSVTVKFGLIDSMGNIILPQQYDDILPMPGKLLVQKNDKWGIVDYRQKVIVPLQYDHYEMDPYAQSFPQQIFWLTYRREGYYKKEYSYDAVFLVPENKLLLLNAYDMLSTIAWSPDMKYRYVFKNGKKGLINARFEEVVPPEYEFFDYHNKMKHGLFRVARDGKFGFWDEHFRPVIPLQYDYAENFDSEGRALVLSNGGFYCIGPDGKKQASCTLSPRWQLGHLGLLTDPHYARVYVDDYCGIIDTTTNKMILPIRYYKAYPALSPVALPRFLSVHKAVFGQKKWEYCGTPDGYAEILYHMNRIIVHNEDGHYGVIDTAFREMIAFRYDSLQVLTSNFQYFLYTEKGKSGIINFSGANTLSPSYDEVRYDKRHRQEWDICKVRKNGKWGVVDLEDNILVPCAYDSIRFLSHWKRPLQKLWIVGKNNHYGVVNRDNKIVVPLEYTGISHLHDHTLWIYDKDRNRHKLYLKEEVL